MRAHPFGSSPRTTPTSSHSSRRRARRTDKVRLSTSNSGLTLESCRSSKQIEQRDTHVSMGATVQSCNGRPAASPGCGPLQLMHALGDYSDPRKRGCQGRLPLDFSHSNVTVVFGTLYGNTSKR